MADGQRHHLRPERFGSRTVGRGGQPRHIRLGAAGHSAERGRAERRPDLHAQRHSQLRYDLGINQVFLDLPNDNDQHDKASVLPLPE